MQWFWSVTAFVPATPNVTNGHARTREEAMTKFRDAWEKTKGGPRFETRK
jgi:predicted RNase H-like HicB family nuclease